ncbi:MAG TPA: ADOP family duplicated permease [Bryobacterales bacterium]|nr:ADOP family duplicated permease [Bryobacterales bacterium]
MSNLLQDIRYSVRLFGRNLPANTVIVLVLAMGIGSSTGIFSIAYRLLQPLPVPYPERLMLIGGAGGPSVRERLDLWSQGDVFARLALYQAGGASLRTANGIERVSAAVVTPEFFDVFQVNPRVGRPVAEAGESAGGVVVLSESIWKRTFGARPDILGESVVLDTQPYVVAGVMPASFRFPGPTDVWVVGESGSQLGQFSTSYSDNIPTSLREAMIGRLNAGVTRTEAETVLNVLLARTKAKNTDPKRGFSNKISATPLVEVLVRGYEQTVMVLLVSVLLLLVIACATAANVLLARLARRQGEMAVRIVLGAGRTRVARQFLLEVSVLAGAAGLLGVLIASGIVEVFRVFAAGSLPGVADVRVDLPVLCFALAFSVLTALVCGLSMMWAVGDTALAGSLKGERGRPIAALGRRLRHAMVVAQVALALVLLTTAGVMVQSLDRLTSIEPGFNPAGAFTVEVLLPRVKYQPDGMTPGQTAVLAGQAASVYTDVERALAAIPGVTAVGSVDKLPLSGESGGSLWAGVDEGRGAIIPYFRCTTGYFRAMGIPLLAGRAFSDRETPAGAKVVIINQAFARAYWGDESPLGARLTIDGPREIVGVVGDVKFNGLGEDAQRQMYFPASQPYRASIPLAMSVVFRGPADAVLIIDELRDRIPPAHDVAFFRARSVDDVIAGSVAPMRFRGVVFTMFAVAALLLAVLAVYGAVANSVVTRTHEIGLRMSVGARRWDILTLFVGQGGRLGLLGVALGIAGTLAMEQLTSSLLFGIDPLDSATLLAAIPFVLAVLLIAAALPAWRASRLDPAQTLRHE